MPAVLSILIDGSDTSVSLRRFKKKELKPLVEALALKLDNLLSLASSPDFIKSLPHFICQNIDFFCDELILPFSDLSPELLDETDVTDIAIILRELLSYNGIDFEKILNFFRGSPVSSSDRAVSFSGVTIPSAT